MQLESPFRAATIDDCPTIARLFSIASDGVADYIWKQLQPEYPGLTVMEIGSKRYSNEESVFSYKNCVVAERHGDVIGMMLAFPIPSTSSVEMAEELPPPEQPEEPDVLAPYRLEAPETWYICALALFSQARRQGWGTQFLSIARQQARKQGFQELSLLCFEQNSGAFKFYQRNAFTVIDRAPVVPHELIHHTGDILLMTAPV